MTISENSKAYGVNTGSVAAEVFDDEAIIMNLQDGMYYTISGVGAQIWSALEQSVSVDEIVEQMSAGFGISKDQAQADAAALFEELLKENLIVAKDDAAAPNRSAVAFSGQYEAPKLQHHDDMADVLAMDPPLPERMETNDG